MKKLLKYLNVIWITLGVVACIISAVALAVGAKWMSDGIGMTAAIKSLFQ